MLEPTKLTIESPEVIRAIKKVKVELGKIAPWRHEKLRLKELEDWFLLVVDAFTEELIQIGYAKNKSQFIPSPHFNTYIEKVRGLRQKAVSKEAFVDWCMDKNQAQLGLIDALVRCHQKDFGEEETGYQPSERLQKGRKALADYHEAHRVLHAVSWTPDVPAKHTPILEKLKADLGDLGWTLEEFNEINEALV